MLFSSSHLIKCIFQIQKKSPKSFEWIYDPTMPDHRFCNAGCNAGSEAPPLTPINVTSDATHSRMNFNTKTPNSERQLNDQKRTREPESRSDFQKHHRGNQFPCPRSKYHDTAFLHASIHPYICIQKPYFF